MQTVRELALAVALAASTGLSAQCQLVWADGDGVPGTDGSVNTACAWDPDGPGPLPERILLAGGFSIGGTVRGSIVAYEPVQRTWQSLGETGGQIFDLLPLPSGELIAVGFFDDIGGVSAKNVARFDGTSWSPMGAGITGYVNSLARLPNGDVAAGGDFPLAGGVPVAGLARWDGSQWSSLGSVLFSSFPGSVAHMTETAAGDLLISGSFDEVDGVPAVGFARYDGSVWSPLASSLLQSSGAPGIGHYLTELAGGDLLAFGRFDSIDGVTANHAARFDGQSWSAYGGAATPVGVRAVERANGDVIAIGGWASANGLAEVRRFDGTSWLPVGGGMRGRTGVTYIHELVVTGADELFAFGSFSFADGQPAANAAKWDGASWIALAPGCDYGIEALQTLRNGDLIAGGLFRSIGQVAARAIARYDGMAWSEVGGGVDGIVNCVAESSVGDLFVAGDFDEAGGVPARKVARWDGSQWHALAGGVQAPVGSVSAIAVLPNDDVVVGGAFGMVSGVPAAHIARWDGVSWHAFGSGANFFLQSLVVLPSGDLVAGGFFTVIDGVPAQGIARWDGTSWHALGAGLSNSVPALAVSPNGDLFAAHGHAQSGAIERWDGSSWQPVGGSFDGLVQSLQFLPDGSLLAGGGFAMVGGQPANGVARWDGTVWAGIALGVEEPRVESVAVLPDGDLVVGGWFLSGGAPGNSYLARMESSCPAAAAVVGAGCTGSAGPVALIADDLPWLGGTFRSTTTGVAANAVAVEVFGLGALATPLASLLPQGLPGCQLLVTPDVLLLSVPSAGTVATEWTMPVASALVGQSFRQQTVVAELSGAIAAVASSNAILATIGSY